MNNIKYNILWLDDMPIVELPIIEEQYPEFHIEKVDYVDVCKHLIESQSENYHAVILDANGIKSSSPQLVANKSGFQEVVLLARKEKKLPVYIYSGQLNRGDEGSETNLILEFLETNGFFEGASIFYKSGGPYDLMDKIKDDLENEYTIFNSYPALLDNVLHYGVNRDCLTKLLLWMKDHKSYPFPEPVDLRRIIMDEAIDTRLKKFFGIPKITVLKRDKITAACMEEWEKDVIFNLFKNLSNTNVHLWPSDNSCMREVLANSFVIALEWFNRFMHKIEVENDPSLYYLEAQSSNDTSTNVSNTQETSSAPYVGIIEKDEKNGFYHVGPYLLKSDWAYKYVGKKIKVVKEGFFNYKKIAYKTEFVLG